MGDPARTARHREDLEGRILRQPHGLTGRDQGKVDIRTQTGGREHSFSKIARQIGERETL